MVEITTDEKIQVCVETARYAALKILSDSDKIKKLNGLQAMADFLGVTKRTVSRYKAKKAIPFLQIGRTVIFDKDDVLNALKKEVEHG